MKSYRYSSIGLLTVLISMGGALAQEQSARSDPPEHTDTAEQFIHSPLSDQDGLSNQVAANNAFPGTHPDNASVVPQAAGSNSYLTPSAARAVIAEKNASLEQLHQSSSQKLAELHERSMQNMFILGSLVSALLLLFLLWGRYEQYRQNQRLSVEVRNRTNELEWKNQQLLEANRALEQVSMRDALTGLNNRKFLDAHLPGEISRTSHYFASTESHHCRPGNDLVAFLIDIDHFKRINDEFGHLAGDRVLVQFTAVLGQVFRETDLLIRWGGEEFLAVCRHADREQSVDLANRVLEAVRQKRFYLPDNTLIHVTCSIGFSALPVCRQLPYSLDWQQSFALIDYCLYAAKISQRDCWVGIADAREEGRPTDDRFPLKAKFGIPGADVKTSLNNIASIHWPD